MAALQGGQDGSQMPPSPPSGGASNHTTPSKRKGSDEDSPDATPSKMRRGESIGIRGQGSGSRVVGPAHGVLPLQQGCSNMPLLCLLSCRDTDEAASCVSVLSCQLGDLDCIASHPGTANERQGGVGGVLWFMHWQCHVCSQPCAWHLVLHSRYASS